MDWPRLLACITGGVDQELLLRNEYLSAENRIPRAKIKGIDCNCQTERNPLWPRWPVGWYARLGPKSPSSLDPIRFCAGFAGWWRKFDGSLFRQTVGRPRVDPAIENLIVRMARDNPMWGYDRIVGALTNLGHTVSDHTVGNILKWYGVAPAPQRKHTTRWRDFIGRTWMC